MHVNMNKSQMNIIMLHVDKIYLACMTGVCHFEIQYCHYFILLFKIFVLYIHVIV